MYVEQERHPVAEILLSLSLSFSRNNAKNMIEIELFIEYFSYCLHLLDYFSKIIFHTV